MSATFVTSINILSKIGDILVHVDKRVSLEDFISIKDNVTFLDNRIAVRWGGFDQIIADIELLKAADAAGPYDYVFMMSGECMPIQDNDSIIKFLEINRGKEFIYADKKSQDINVRLKYRYPHYYSDKNRNICLSAFIVLCDKIPWFHRNPFLKKNPYFNMLPPLYKGGNWFTISGQCNKYILDYIISNPNYLIAFKESHCGDEIFFHTLVYNSEFRCKIYEDNTSDIPTSNQLRYIDWKKGPDFPRILTQEDYPAIKESRCLIARKITDKINLSEFENYFNLK